MPQKHEVTGIRPPEIIDPNRIEIRALNGAVYSMTSANHVQLIIRPGVETPGNTRVFCTHGVKLFAVHHKKHLIKISRNPSSLAESNLLGFMLIKIDGNSQATEV